MEDTLKDLLKFLRDYKKESVIAPLFKMLEALFELMIPLVVSNIIDFYIAHLLEITGKTATGSQTFKKEKP